MTTIFRLVELFILGLANYSEFLTIKFMFYTVNYFNYCFHEWCAGGEGSHIIGKYQKRHCK